MYYSTMYDERIQGFHYASEPDRLQQVSEDRVRFTGRHSIHTLTHTDEHWQCDCASYQRRDAAHCEPLFCAHVIAVERLLHN